MEIKLCEKHGEKLKKEIVKQGLGEGYPDVYMNAHNNICILGLEIFGISVLNNCPLCLAHEETARHAGDDLPSNYEIERWLIYAVHGQKRWLKKEGKLQGNGE